MYGLTSLQQLIDLLTIRSKAHICIHDFSGILNQAMLRIEPQHQIHSRPVCTLAKSTARGYRICIRCKTIANQRAVADEAAFAGYCFYGLYEIAHPVLIDGIPRCIVYIGNLCADREESARRMRRMCRLTGVSAESMLACLDDAENAVSLTPYRQMAGLIESYIRLLLPNAQASPPEAAPEQHWAVQALIRHIELNYNRDISLQRLARLYFLNGKYLGRLFCRQTGQTFHEYLNQVRLRQAEYLLAHTAQSILGISLDCGFQNVTYFNRVFARRHGMSPSQFRKTANGSLRELSEKP